MSQKARYSDPSQRRLYPLATFNSWCARPLSAALAPVLSANAVSALSLLVSLVGLAFVWQAAWQPMLIGGGLIHLGLILDHADGQVARRRGGGTTWGMYLDMVIDRIIEIGIIIALVPALRTGVAGAWLPSWSPMPASLSILVAMALVGIMMLWRFLTAYNDVLFLRDHLLAAQRMPDRGLRARRLVKRPVVPWVFNRDWVLALWVLGIATAQVQGLILLLLALHGLACLEKVLVFRARHDEPEADAARVLGRDYH